MTEKTPTDPFAMFRDMVNQWEKSVNDYGGKIASSSEFVQGMQGMTALSMQVQQAVHQAMSKVLEAANMPNRDDVAALGMRISQIEAQLSRIEAALGASSSRSKVAKPKRTKKPPAKTS